jgi:hypothetical protein
MGRLLRRFAIAIFGCGDVLSQVLRISTRQDQIGRDKGESRRRITSRRRWLIGFVVCCAVWLSWGAPLLAEAQPPPETEPETPAAVIESIVGCLAKGEEAVLRQKQPVDCYPFGKGADHVPEENINIASICNDPADQRRLSGNAIKLVASRKDKINPTGIRVLGGVYCKKLDLVGLELPFSLVLDKSVFAEGVQARSFRTQGDLSFDNSLMFGELFLARVHVDGTLFADEAVIQKMRLLDAEIHGSALFRSSVILDLAAFDTVQLSGELSVRNALFPYLLVQFSKVGGVLDLTDSRARCAYKIRKNEIGDIAAINTGFGTEGPPPPQIPDGKSQYEWKPPRAGSKASALLKLAEENMPPNSDQSAIGKICDHSAISFSPGSLLITDTKVKSSLCLRSFHWLEGALSPKSYVTVQDVTVGTSALIDLAKADVEPKPVTENSPKPVTDMTHTLEIIDLETGSLFLNFNVDLAHPRNPQPYAMYISGLKFEQVYAAKVACLYEPNFSDSDTTKASNAEKAAKKAAALTGAGAPGSLGDPLKAAKQSIRVLSLSNDANPAAQSRLPMVEEVTGWLDGNLLATTQPFQAFVDVFQKHGDDNDATELRVRKADAELCLKAQRLFGDWICGRAGQVRSGASAEAARLGMSLAADSSQDSATTSASTGKQTDLISWLFSKFQSGLQLGADFISVVLGGVLWLIADNGYHPQKVGYFVVLSIVLFGVYFWFILRAVGLLPKEKHIILPFGIVFLFDRLLPAYQIREDHYNVAEYYVRAPKAVTEAATKPKPGETTTPEPGRVTTSGVNTPEPGTTATSAPEVKYMRYAWLKWPVIAATDDQRLTIERSLDVLKVLGLVLAVFLVAAINAMVSH